jgi:hypothetical protein
MVEVKIPAFSAEEQLRVANEQAPNFERVEWKKDPALRKLYMLCTFGLMVASATTGYDG